MNATRGACGRRSHVDAGVGAGEVVAAIELHVGLLYDRDPQLLRVRRVRRHHLPVPREREAVVNEHLARDAVDMQLDEVLARRVVDG